MKQKCAFALVLAAACALLLVLPVSADLGPKPSLEILVKNPPDGLYYLDLLVQFDPGMESGSRLEGLDDEMVSVLRGYSDGDWHAALVCPAAGPPILGELTGEPVRGGMLHSFSYRIPDAFRIAVVTQDGTLAVSETVRPRRFHASLTYDFSTGRVSQPPLLLSYLLQFFSTCIPTLAIEGVLLLLFGFSLAENWRAFLLVNLFTQLALTATMGVGMVTGGLLLAYFIYIPMELFILLAELCAYLFLLKGRSRWRRAGYAMTANLVSAGTGLFLLPLLDFLQLLVSR